MAGGLQDGRGGGRAEGLGWRGECGSDRGRMSGHAAEAWMGRGACAACRLGLAGRGAGPQTGRGRALPTPQRCTLSPCRARGERPQAAGGTAPTGSPRTPRRPVAACGQQATEGMCGAVDAARPQPAPSPPSSPQPAGGATVPLCGGPGWALHPLDTGHSGGCSWPRFDDYRPCPS